MKDKGKGKMVEVEKDPKKGKDITTDISDAEHTRLIMAQRELRYKARQKEHSLKHRGVSNDSTILDMEVEDYLKIKDDSRIVEALSLLYDIQKRLNITPEEEEIDARVLGISIEEYKETREKGIKEDKLKALSLVAQVKGLKAPGPQATKKKRSESTRKPKTLKEHMDSRLDSFQPIRPQPTSLEHDPKKSEVLVRNKLALEKFEKSKRMYQHIQNFRNRPSKIMDVKIRLIDNSAKFGIKLKRADGELQEMAQAGFMDFGYQEWLEMMEILVMRGPSKDESAWLRYLKKKIEIKPLLEKELGISPAEQVGQSSGLKRKTTGESSQNLKKSC